MVIVATFVFILPQIADYRDCPEGREDRSRGIDLGQLLAAAALLNVVTFAPPWMAALPRLRFRQALVVTQASTASTYVAPGGPAVGMTLSYAMLRAWGFQRQAVSLAVAVTGAWNQLAMLAFPAVALGLLTYQGEGDAALQTAALIGVIVLVVVVAGFAAGLSSASLARRVGDLAARVTSWCFRADRGESPSPGAAKRSSASATVLEPAAEAPVARAHRRHARGASDGLPRDDRVAPGARRPVVGRHRDRGVRGLGARPPARLDPDHARRPRHRRARPHHRPRRLRRQPAGRRRRRARLPLPDDRADARVRPAGRRGRGSGTGPTTSEPST